MCSKIDLKDIYHQILLSIKSRPVTTFSTHIGVFGYKLLHFGINAAEELLQDIIRQTLENTTEVINIDFYQKSDLVKINGRTRQITQNVSTEADG